MCKHISSRYTVYWYKVSRHILSLYVWGKKTSSIYVYILGVCGMNFIEYVDIGYLGMNYLVLLYLHVWYVHMEYVLSTPQTKLQNQ